MREEIFTRIYETNYWGGKDSVSGLGSDTIPTGYLVTELGHLLKNYQIATMLDIPCGDFNWMKRVKFDGHYIGADIVKPLVERNREFYADERREFVVLDIVKDQLPKVDLIFTRDCLVHLTLEEIGKAIENIKKSKAKYLLATNYFWRELPFNHEIRTGEWRRLSLHKPPFNFPFPQEILIEGYFYDEHKDKSMALWQIKDLP